MAWRDEAKQAGYLFPYLFDESQQVALRRGEDRSGQDNLDGYPDRSMTGRCTSATMPTCDPIPRLTYGPPSMSTVSVASNDRTSFAAQQISVLE